MRYRTPIVLVAIAIGPCCLPYIQAQQVTAFVPGQSTNSRLFEGSSNDGVSALVQAAAPSGLSGSTRGALSGIHGSMQETPLVSAGGGASVASGRGNSRGSAVRSSLDVHSARQPSLKKRAIAGVSASKSAMEDQSATESDSQGSEGSHTGADGGAGTGGSVHSGFPDSSKNRGWPSPPMVSPEMFLFSASMGEPLGGFSDVQHLNPSLDEFAKGSTGGKKRSGMAGGRGRRVPASSPAASLYQSAQPSNGLSNGLGSGLAQPNMTGLPQGLSSQPQ